MSIELPDLPYPLDALEPYISKRAMEFHYKKHHGGYVSKLNQLIKGSPYASMTLEKIIENSAGKRGQQEIFNNAAQVWNHTFFWNTMGPQEGGTPGGPLASRIRDAFGSYDEFCDTFIQTAVSHFGSGWVWLSLDRNKLVVSSTPDALSPLLEAKLPLMTCDIWEHAYYLDYQDRRKDFVKMFLTHLVEWDHIAERLEHASDFEQEIESVAQWDKRYQENHHRPGHH